MLGLGSRDGRERLVLENSDVQYVDKVGEMRLFLGLRKLVLDGSSCYHFGWTYQVLAGWNGLCAGLLLLQSQVYVR